MLLIWIIVDQIKWEKKCKEHGWEPAVSMKERLKAYFICVFIPIVVGLLMGYLDANR